MVAGNAGNGVHGAGTETTVKIDIDPDILARLEALPNVRGIRGHQWTAQEDEILNRYWLIKRKADVAKVIGVNEKACRERWEELHGNNAVL